jgi:hypothetical protein
MTEILGIGKKPVKLEGMEKLLGDKFAEPEREMYKPHIGRPVRLIPNGQMGIYRGETRSGNYVLWPCIIHESLGDSNPRPRFRWEYERPMQIKSGGVVGVEPVNMKYLEDMAGEEFDPRSFKEVIERAKPEK